MDGRSHHYEDTRGTGDTIRETGDGITWKHLSGDHLPRWTEAL